MSSSYRVVSVPERLQRFREEYTAVFQKEYEEFPSRYQFITTKFGDNPVPTVVARLFADIGISGATHIDLTSPVTIKTCKRLGIRVSKRSINEFLSQGLHPS